MSFQMHQNTILQRGDIQRMNTAQLKDVACTDSNASTNNLAAAILGIINYLGKFLSSPAEVCDPLGRLTSFKY